MSKKYKKVAPNVVKSGPVFNYTSECCSKPGKKSPCERSKADREASKFSESPLGSWRCSQCEKPCKVKRSRVKGLKEPDGTETRTETL